MESDGRSNAARNSSYLRKITILVVDNDPTSLAMISGMLEIWSYEVAAVNSSIGALYTLREHPTIDLVLADVDMPEMDGFELLRHIDHEFEVPVIMMSSNGEDSVIQKCLSGGAVFFLVKPVNPYDLKNLWQYPAAKRGQSFVIDEIESTVTVGESSSAGSSSIGGIDENNNAKKVSKRKAPMNSNDDQEEETASARRKDKVVWTNSLHDKFLEAIRQIAPERVVPKKIHELMNVQGLTRQNVASHLQKYRSFLKDVAESSRFSSAAFSERVLRSSFAYSHPLLIEVAQDYMRLQEMQRMRGLTFPPGYEGIVSANVAASPEPILFPNQNASSSNSAQPNGYGQSSLLGNQANKRQVIPGNMNPLYHGNRFGYANGSNLSLNGGFSGGLINASNGLMNGVKSEHTYPQQIQARPHFYTAGSSSHFSFGSPGLHSSNSTLGTGIIGSTSTSPLGLNSSCTNNIIHAGSRLPTDGQLLGMDQTGLNGGYGSMTGTFNQNMNVAAMGNRTAAIKAEGEFSATGLDGYGSMTGTCNQNMNVAAMGNQTSGIKAEGGFSATGLDGANQVSPAYTAANQQAIASMLPGPGNGGATDYKSDHLMNNASNTDNITLTQQPGDSYFSDFLLVLKNYQQQLAGGGVLNPESANAMFREICSKLEEFLNSDFPESFSLDETGPWSEEALRKIQRAFEELIYTDIGGGANPSDGSSPITFNQNTNQQQSGGGQLINSESSYVFQVKNEPGSGDHSSDNQQNCDRHFD